MQDILSMLNALRRPRLLMRAARIGAQEYRRSVHLPRLIGYSALPRHGAAILRLVQMEEELNDLRLNGDSGYSLLRHVDLLIALVGEARLYKATLSSAT